MDDTERLDNAAAPSKWASFLRKNVYLVVVLIVAVGLLIEGAYEHSRARATTPVEDVGSAVKEVVSLPIARMADKSSWLYLRDYVQQVVEQAAPSLALAGQSRTTGILVETNLLLTSLEAIDSTEVTRIELFDGTRADGKLVGLDQESNLALLKLSDGVAGIAFELSPLDEELSWVAAVGLDKGRVPVVSLALLSPAALGGGPLSIQGTRISPPHGADGTGILDFDGKLVGYSPTDSGGQALWGDSLRDIVQQLKQQGRIRRPWIGLEVIEVDLAVLEHLEASSGVVVSSVFYRGPAWRSGVRGGDLLVELNGQPVSDRSNLQRIMSRVPVGTTCDMKVLRRGRALTFSVTAEERTERQRLAAGGEWVPSLGASLSAERGVVVSEGVRVSGLRVNHVSYDGPAFAAGIRPQDVIIAANDRPMLAASQLTREINRPNPALIKLLRGDQYHLVLIRRSDGDEAH